MGSSGSGNFSDYSGSRGGSRKSGVGSGNTGSQKDTGSDRCLKEMNDVRIQEIERSKYYEEHESVPRKGTKVVVRKELVDGRIAVETKSGKEIIGVLPTRLNYVRRCMEQGYSYSGEVSESSAGLVPSIHVDLEAVG